MTWRLALVLFSILGWLGKAIDEIVLAVSKVLGL